MTMARLDPHSRLFCPLCRSYAPRLFQGACWKCAIDRHEVAVEYIRASTAVHLLISMGAVVKTEPKFSPGGRPRNHLTQALDRLRLADEECMRLKLWKAERTTRRPPWFYGDERSNTR